MSRILLLHHLGLGDHFMCHGIVREYAKRYGQVTIFSYSHNYPTVAFMFRDLSNVAILKIKDVEAAREYLVAHGAEYDAVKVLGFEHLNRTRGTQLEKQFYDEAGMPLAKKWDSFYVERDRKREEALYQKAAPKSPYAFLHEDAPRKYLITRRHIPKGCAIFVPDAKLTENLLDYCTIIENAKEIHVIDSSFMFLIDCLPYENPHQKLIVHRYARENNDWQLPILRKDWHIVTAERSLFDPLRGILERLYGSNVFPFTTKFAKRAIRWFFRQMLWTMGRPETLAVEPIVRRYVPTRSFVEIGSDRYVEEAKGAGATLAIATSLEDARADVILYHGDPSAVLPELRRRTGTILMLVGRFPTDIEQKLTANNFGVRERQLFSGDSCLVCRAV